MSPHSPKPPTDTDSETVGVEAVLGDLEELEEIVDSEAELQQVRETMRLLRRIEPSRPLRRLKASFDSRDVGEEVVGSFVFGMPMIVEDGTLEIGEFIGQNVVYFSATVAIGVALVYGILHTIGFAHGSENRLGGFVPVRFVSIPLIAAVMALVLMTLWGRVDWASPWVASGQVLITAIVMSVGASLGDVLPRR